MAEEVKAVEPAQTPATEQPASTVDYEALYKEQADRLRKAEEEAHNLRKGYNKYKTIAKAKEEEDEQPDSAELMRQIAQEELAKSTVLEERKKLEELNLQMARELKEAKVALGNKTGIATSMGSGQGSMPEVKSQFFSEEQITSLKKRGFTDEMIKQAANNAANPRYPGLR